MQSLFSDIFSHKINRKNVILNAIYDNLKIIDKLIEESAVQFPIEKIARVDASILRLAVYELVLERKEPPKVIIDEAIELAKEFGSDTSSSFINGVLGAIYKNMETK